MRVIPLSLIKRYLIRQINIVLHRKIKKGSMMRIIDNEIMV